ncbi:MAG TPA: DUF3027 domain-containing protein [Lacisediminihabitans sp.]|uniref:DUF3027 domain-containing protein n=1 Tax=Lacisediminihabitans sp. TaxID=2787631 RepID=UPI002ED78005
MSDTGATVADFELGRRALLEITSAASIGAPAGSIDEGDGTVTVYFDTTLAGYPGWRWTVSIAHVDGEEPSALETELTPGDGALLSPAWIPWVDRLADYRAAQDALGAEEDSDEEADDDDADEDDFGSDVLHGGDLDGVDIDDDLEDDIDDHIDDDEELDGLALPPAGVDEADETEDEADDGGPEQPEFTGGDKRAK